MTGTLLDRALAAGGLAVKFQPVVEASLPGRPWCYVEGLVRGPAGTNVENADVLFSYIRRKREVRRMDRRCVEVVLQAASAFPASAAIGLNVDAETLTSDEDFPRYVIATAGRHGITGARLVVEVVERSFPLRSHAFQRALAALRAAGVRIALDDVGCAYSNYRMMLDVRPDFFKVDRYLVHGAGSDPLRLDVLRSIAALAGRFGARVVAEGLENETDLAAVRAAGIDLVQGFLFAKPLPPAAIVARWPPEIVPAPESNRTKHKEETTC